MKNQLSMKKIKKMGVKLMWKKIKSAPETIKNIVGLTEKVTGNK